MNIQMLCFRRRNSEQNKDAEREDSTPAKDQTKISSEQ